MICVAVLQTARFQLRPLRLDDATARYLGWLRDPGAQHIASRAETQTLADLKSYVAAKIAQPDVAFFGIFERDTQLHIGNLKFEPIDRQLGYAVFGILIGDAAYRGQGVAGEVLAAGAVWLKNEGIGQIVLGVAADNPAAIRAYEKAGFRIAATPFLPAVAGTHRMVRLL